jgi:hypothetical protein
MHVFLCSITWVSEGDIELAWFAGLRIPCCWPQAEGFNEALDWGQPSQCNAYAGACAEYSDWGNQGVEGEGGLREKGLTRQVMLPCRGRPEMKGPLAL